MSLTTQPDLRSTVTRDVLVDIEQFLFEEAELLDQWRLHEWLDLFAPEGYYEIPATDRPDGDPTRDLFLVHDDRFLASLASIELVDTALRDRIGPSEQTAAGALFAVLAEPDAPTLEWVLRQRRPNERAVAFVPDWSARSHDALVDAGWQCVVFTPGDDLAEVWAAVSTLAGRS